MVQLNDHYFISYLVVVKGMKFEIKNNKIYVAMTTTQYTEYLEEYKTTIKPILVHVRNIVKKLNAEIKR